MMAGTALGTPPRRTQEVSAPMPIQRTPEERFWQKVDKTGDCWIWTGSRNRRGGYGQFWLNGRFILAHRFAFGNVPAGAEVCHHCDTPLCVRRDHLFLGTHGDNMRDASQKKRLSTAGMPPLKRGSDNGNAILSAEQVCMVRQRIANGEVQRRLATEFGVSNATISAIHKRRLWGHL